MIKLKDLLNEGLDPKAQRFLDAIQMNDRNIKDLKNITVDATPQGNWIVYLKGKKLCIVNHKMLDDRTIMKYGLEEGITESVQSMKMELMKQLQWVTIQLKKSTNSSDIRKYTKIKMDTIAKLDHIKKTGKYENVNEDGFPGGVGVGLSLPGGYINGAPSYDKVKSTKKRLQNDKNDRYTEVEKK
jgi:hypothetical protein